MKQCPLSRPRETCDMLLPRDNASLVLPERCPPLGEDTWSHIGHPKMTPASPWSWSKCFMYHFRHRGSFTSGNSLLETVCPHLKFRASDLRLNLFWPNQIPLHYLTNLAWEREQAQDPSLPKSRSESLLLSVPRNHRAGLRLREMYSSHVQRPQPPKSAPGGAGSQKCHRGKKRAAHSSLETVPAQRVPKLASITRKFCLFPKLCLAYPPVQRQQKA